MLLPRVTFFLAITALIGACTSGPAGQPISYPTYDPFVQSSGALPLNDNSVSMQVVATRHSGPPPTLAPLTVLIPTHDPALALASPTPDAPRAVPTQRQSSSQYAVQAGDTLGSIADANGISVEALQQANGLPNGGILNIGQDLVIPIPSPREAAPSFKVIPDSELVYGPASADFNIADFIQARSGYLASYTEQLNQDTLTGAQVIERVAQNYSVNPRLLLALLDYRSQWVSSAQPLPGTADYPLGFVDANHRGLYRQLEWAASEFNRGFYLWRVNGVSSWVLGDDSVVPVDPTVNAGTAAVQNLFSILDDHQTWETDITAFGLFQTYFFLFGNPFDRAVEPLLSVGLSQPPMGWPFARGGQWAFTGGPHAAWDYGSAWGALDFAPSDVMGCAMSEEWVTAVADGYIVRAANGAVVEDLDGDGYEQTGWDVLYMHMAAEGRVKAGTYVYAGDHIGHPSCEGGLANAAHLHLVRKYNGEWIGADGSLPFNLAGWSSSGDGTQYDGYLKRGARVLEAAEGITDNNQIAP